MFSNKRRTRRSAFTLIELLLVLVILAVLATIVVMNFGSIFGQSDDTKVKTDISNLDVALETYHAQLRRVSADARRADDERHRLARLERALHQEGCPQ